MAAKQIDIADAIKDLLNSDDFGSQYENFTATRIYLPSFTVPELATLRVVVVPGPQLHTKVSRSRWDGPFTTFIGVFKKVDSANVGQFDDLQEIVSAIIDRIKLPANAINVAGASLTSVSAGRGEAESETLPFLIEHLQDKHTFTSVITVVHYVSGV